MSLVSKVLNFVGIDSEEDVSEEAPEENEKFDDNFLNHDFKNPLINKKNKAVNKISSELQLVVTRLESFEEAKDVVDHLLSKRPVVVNLESVEKEVARRIIDFLSGSIYTLSGNIQKVSSGIFLFTPQNIGVLGNLKDEVKRSMFPWN
ncbi:MAG: cell division protein SepF [Clostridiales bacterium]|jgi:cell division inhibitor SepF|nr:cell division protein SepF [Clostridiales bacterium]